MPRQQRFKGGTPQSRPQKIMSASDIEAMIADAVPDLSKGELAIIAVEGYRAAEQPPVGVGLPNTVWVHVKRTAERVAAHFSILEINPSLLNEGTPVLVKVEEDGEWWIQGSHKKEADRAYQNTLPQPNLLMAPHDHTGGTQGPQIDIVTGTTGNQPKSRGGTGANLDSTGPGFLHQASAGANVTVIKHNLGASVDPTASDDVGDGYIPGSVWINITTNTAFICTQNNTSNAVWIEVGGSGGGGGGMEDFQLAGDSGTDTITDGQTVTVEGGDGIETEVTASTGTVVVRMNPSSLASDNMTSDQAVLWANGTDVNRTNVGDLPYFPVNTGDWPDVPNRIFDALDKIAARVYALENP